MEHGEVPELRAVVDRNAAAVMTGDFLQLMSDITPEALAKLMQMTPAGGGPSLTALPAIASYDVVFLGDGGDGHRYRAVFRSATTTASFTTLWKLVLGQWRVVDFEDVAIVAGDAPPPAP